MILVYECLRKKKKRGREKAEQEVTETGEEEQQIKHLWYTLISYASCQWSLKDTRRMWTASRGSGSTGRPLSITCIPGPLHCWHCTAVLKRQFWTEHKTVLRPHNLHLDAAEISDGSTSKLSLQFPSKFLLSCDACYPSYKMPSRWRGNINEIIYFALRTQPWVSGK